MLIVVYRRFGTACRSHLAWSSSCSWTSRYLKIGPIGCPKLSVNNYQYTLRTIPEAWRPQRTFLCMCVCLSLSLHAHAHTHTQTHTHTHTHAHRADGGTHLCFEALVRSQVGSAAKPHCIMQLIVESLLSPIIFAECSEFFSYLCCNSSTDINIVMGNVLGTSGCLYCTKFSRVFRIETRWNFQSLQCRTAVYVGYSRICSGNGV
jgi:hypothetical protein